jgi:hypothetical protein
MWSVERKRRNAATLCRASLALVGQLAELLTILAADRKGQDAKSHRGDLIATFETTAVRTCFEPAQCGIDPTNILSN